MEIVDYQTDFQLGTAVGMRDGYLTLGEEIKNNMPDIISEKLIKPILKNNNLAVNQVQDWSLHQGGLPILQSFTDEKNLNLTNEQIKRSKQMFQKHGNLSSPSAFSASASFIVVSAARACSLSARNSSERWRNASFFSASITSVFFWISACASASLTLICSSNTAWISRILWSMAALLALYRVLD